MMESGVLPYALHVEAEVHDVAVLNDVVLALDGQLASLADSGLRAVLQVVVVLDDFGADKALLEVCVDDAGTLGSLPALLIGPRLYLHLASRDESLEVQQGVGLLDEAVHAALLQALLLEEHLLVLIAFQFSNILLGLSGDNHCLGTFLLGQRLDFLGEGVATLGILFADVADVEHGFAGGSRGRFY